MGFYRVIRGYRILCGWLSKLWSLFGYPKYYNRDPKRDQHFDNHPYRVLVVGAGSILPLAIGLLKLARDAADVLLDHLHLVRQISSVVYYHYYCYPKY